MHAIVHWGRYGGRVATHEYDVAPPDDILHTGRLHVISLLLRRYHLLGVCIVDHDVVGATILFIFRSALQMDQVLTALYQRKIMLHWSEAQPR
uniref:Uncharacterized protein n=1 Tax=Candidatus Kentrum sp. LPFa TaxID=2126335 RepID=A0A450VUH2_9GAMM|nr:MAG: hypothetical protein BECKLPF1236A_GA0070988_1001722 [Candidatus Kentron sp. LPFa]